MIIIPAIFALRIFGFMAILPVISVVAEHYSYYSLALVGWVIGIYGLMQACFHIPMGFLSDRYGRRLVVLLGLTVMLVGSIVAASSASIYGLILGRALQGAGAIGSVLNAWCVDITPEKHITKAMALIGMTIGATFLLAMVLGPVIVEKVELSGLFWLTALLSVIAMLLTTLLPEADQGRPVLFSEHFARVISESSLRSLNFGIFTLHASYTALFLVVPGWVGDISHAWKIYLPMVLTGVFLALPSMFLAEAKGFIRQVLLVASLMLFGSQLILIMHGSWKLALFVYFAAFTMLEALLPSLLSKYAPAGCKGTAMGAFACFQYLGIFAGSVIGGWLLHGFNVVFMLLFGISLTALWLLRLRRLPVIAINK